MDRWWSRLAIWLFLPAFFLSFAAAAAAYRIEEGAEDAAIVLPAANHREAGRQAAVILLPYTGGTAQDLFNWYYAASYGRHDAGPTPVLALMPDKGRRSDYRSGKAWAETVEDYEEKIKEVIADLVEEHNVDPRRIAIGGFSMGGDLGWALALRNPDMFRGVLVMGSRCNWREQGSPARLQASGTRAAFFAGMRDKQERLVGLHAARDLLNRAGVKVRYDELTDTGHLPAPPKTFWSALQWLVGPEEPITASADTAASCTAPGDGTGC